MKDASTIDASEYTSMNIFCNYAEKEQTEECITSIPEGGVFSKNIINIKSYIKNVRIRSPQNFLKMPKKAKM